MSTAYTPTLRSLLTLFAVCLATAGAQAAESSDTARPGFRRVAFERCQPASGHHGPLAGDRSKMLDHHLEQLKADLKLRDDQQGAWKTYSEALRGQQKEMQATWQRLREQAPKEQPTSAVARMQKHLDLSKQQEARLADLLKITENFYSALSPQQQAVFDQQHVRQRPGHHGPGLGHDTLQAPHIN